MTSMAEPVSMSRRFSNFKLPSSNVVPLLFFILISGGSLYWIYFSLTMFDASETNVDKQEGPKSFQFLRKNELELQSLNETMRKRTCPEYFRWIHEDLRPWNGAGISRDMVERAKDSADFRLVILKGKVYVEKLRDAFESRDLFSIWGILQLLKLYPDRVPDLELMFNCADRPMINKSNHQPFAATSPPPIFQYCKGEGQLGILFPDWSFWGWAEVNVKPWRSLIESIREGNKRTKWKDRQPYAYWKGNLFVNYIRPKLNECKVSDKYDWPARLYQLDWKKEVKEGYKNSKLEDQCTHRYKIYVEGWGWSVSEKYILACDSMALFIKPKFYDFFTRSLVPMQHFWHVRRNNMCKDIKLAVEWGNNHTSGAEAIGKAGSKFIHENLKMKYVYDYMIHVLGEYAKLMKFKPIIPKAGVEISPLTMARSQNGTRKKFMEESMVESPTKTLPCRLPPPYESDELQSVFRTKENIYRMVETWEDEYWKMQHL